MMICLDVGNSQIFGGVFVDEVLRFQFRKSSRSNLSSDEVGLFLRQVLRENGFDPAQVKAISICSVVPDHVFSIRGACQKYFSIEPFVLQAGVKTGLKIRYHNPTEVGADRIANAVAAIARYPGKNLVIVDFGTATTFCVVNKDKEYLGGLIIPGIRLAMESLEAGTAKLPKVEIVKPSQLIGRSTVESIQAGLYFGNLAMVQSLAQKIKTEVFGGEIVLTLGTGGFSRLFENEGVFDINAPDLVLEGLFRAANLNAPRINVTVKSADEATV